MRPLSYLAFPVLFILAGCSKSADIEARWLETSQRREVIIFNAGMPGESAAEQIPGEGNFFFQSRPLPSTANRASESGIYFYTIEGDSLLLKTRQEKFYFKMSQDKKTFTIGRFFYNPGGLPYLLVF